MKTARYVKLKTAKALNDGLCKQYLSSLQETVSGKEKYYRSGMGMCLLLDKSYPEWKHNAFAGTYALDGWLENTMEEF